MRNQVCQRLFNAGDDTRYVFEFVSDLFEDFLALASCLRVDRRHNLRLIDPFCMLIEFCTTGAAYEKHDVGDLLKPTFDGECDLVGFLQRGTRG